MRFVTILAALLVAACSFQEGEPLCLEDCGLCDGNTCPEDRCGLVVILAKDCDGKVEQAEVAVDNCLQEETVAPGGYMYPCATIDENQERTVVVRSDEWVWKRTVKCNSKRAGGVIPLALYCLER
ncbi:MAG: hypothetical protein FJ109_12035 [Deltaproteobacteria bacterium]|nr:hypothetical protein [Deltaproteobacteria bacterium]